MYLSSLMQKLFFTVFIIAIVVNFSGSVNAEEDSSKKNIEVIGTGIISDGDIEKGRALAIKNSLFSAVDFAVADLLPLESMIQNFETLNEILYDNVSEFVEYYKVLTELKAGRTYRVLVQATISTDVIERHLLSAGIKLHKKNMPNILLFIAEKNSDNIWPKYWWAEDLSIVISYSEIAIAEGMIRNGFFIINQKSLIGNEKLEAVKYKPNLNNQEAARLGNSFNADVVIVGNSEADIAPNTMGENIKSFKGFVSVRALRTDTGEEIASTMQTAISVNQDYLAGERNALSKAGLLAARELAAQIDSIWEKKAIKSFSKLELIVEGTSYLSNFVIFRRVLHEISGLVTVQLSEMKADEATIIVNFQGNAKELADALMLKNFESFGINIYEVSQNYLRIRLIPS